MNSQSKSKKVKIFFALLTNKCNNSATSYGDFINNNPIGVMVIVLFISVTLTAISFSVTEFPHFDQPRLGFKTQGTEFSGRLLTLQNIESETSIYSDTSKKYYRQYMSYKSRKKKSVKPELEELRVNSSKIILDHSCSDRISSFNRRNTLMDLFSQLVFKYKSTDDLFSLESFRELCKFQLYIDGQLETEYIDIIELGTSWSFPNSVSCHLKKDTCNEITEKDITNLRENLTYCFLYKDYIFECNNRSTSEKNASCQKIPQSCNSQFYYNMFQYILSKEVFAKKSQQIYTVIFLPLLQYENMQLLNRDNSSLTKFMALHEDLEQYVSKRLKYASLVGETYGDKFELFHEYLIKDTKYLLISLVLVSVIILIYSGSIFYCSTVLITLILSFGLAYFVYRLVFRIEFFPHINLLVIVLLIGIGADDTFVLHHIFYLFKRSTERTVNTKDISEAFSNAALSMFVTSATTAAAFYANFYSEIIIVRSFGIFAGSLMLMNYLLVVSWLPASLVAFDRYLMPLYLKICPKKVHIWTYKFQLYCMFLPSTFCLETVMPWLLKKLKYLWIVLFSTTFVVSLVLVFYKPGLQLSKRNLLTVFKEGNTFEWYDDEIEDHFEYPLLQYQQPQQLVLIWGFVPVDNAKMLDPYDSGHLVPDKKFRMTLTVLKEIGDICEKLDNVNYTNLLVHKSCFTRLFFQWSSSLTCSNYSSSTGCCNHESRYFREENLGRCLALATENNKIVEFGGPLFESGTFNVVGFTEYFDSIFTSPPTLDIFGKYMDTIDNDVKEFTSNSSDPTVRDGWFVAAYYQLMMLHDLQTSLNRGTPISIVIAVTGSVIIVILTTKNVLLAVFSVFSVSAVIIVTIASLVLMSWLFNLVEATICILTIGLSFDFTLHYLVGYQLAPLGTRQEKIFATLTYIGVPVLLSAVTTFLAGCAVLFSTTMVFHQTGLFMILVSVISWIYASFFFLSVLSVFGPKDGSCLDYHFFCFNKRRPSIALPGPHELVSA